MLVKSQKSKLALLVRFKVISRPFLVVVSELYEERSNSSKSYKRVAADAGTNSAGINVDEPAIAIDAHICAKLLRKEGLFAMKDFISDEK